MINNIVDLNMINNKKKRNILFEVMDYNVEEWYEYDTKGNIIYFKNQLIKF